MSKIIKTEVRTLHFKKGYGKTTTQQIVEPNYNRKLGHYQLPGDYQYTPDEQNKVMNYFSFIKEAKELFNEMPEVNHVYIKQHKNYARVIEILKMDSLDLNVKYNVKVLMHNQNLVNDLIQKSKETLDQPRKILCVREEDDEFDEEFTESGWEKEFSSAIKCLKGLPNFHKLQVKQNILKARKSNIFL
ncbi:unnamed protein product [Blepharisma stoltei]|uniref:Uncharacterized protein n=1 Tax=Blepharisma stoltei TaxID=1481888 RepID=A0AAU9IJ82_9CILI|nr:unnamed protein product [Blepharisma stoltei]